jgi:hypothetical protein
MGKSYNDINDLYDSNNNESSDYSDDNESLNSLYCKKESWGSQIKNNRPLVIVSIIFIIFICILVYLYFSGKLMINF